MKNRVSRRHFLKTGLVGGAGTGLMGRTMSAGGRATAASEGLCLAQCSHWSYIGIGWQLGIESSVLSVTDAMEIADRAPYVKTGINLDAHAYEFMAEKFPEIAERLKKYLADGKVELIGGTYSQPMGTMWSGESNIRQIVYGRETIRKALGYEMVTFLEEEEFSHPQLPQILIGAGYRYASLAQLNTWGNAGVPEIELDVFRWQGKDGTAVTCVPKNSLFGYSVDPEKLTSSPGFKKLLSLGKPLIVSWEEFGWEPPEEPAYLTAPEKYLKFAKQWPVEFVTLKEYLDKYGSGPKTTRYLDMDAWNKLLPWGIGGDQLRVMERKVEGMLLAAERFDALASTLGMDSQYRALERAWKDMLTAQSHDVSLCEYSRWQGDRMAPLDRIEDHHNFTWGAIGYNHLDSAEKQAQSALDASLQHVVKRVKSDATSRGKLAVTVFNPCAWERTGVARTGRIYPLPFEAKDIVVRDPSGRKVLSQIVKAERDARGNLIVADAAFLAERIPSVGYDTYYLEPAPETARPSATDLQINQPNLALENEFIRIRLGPTHGAVVSLIDKRSGQEMLDGSKAPFPVFRGTPNRDYGPRTAFIRGKYHLPELVIPPFYDSSESVAKPVATGKGGASSEGKTDWRVISKSEIRWIQAGPLCATVKTSHNWPLLKFETYITLYAGMPWVEVISRVLAQTPPAPDELGPDHRFPIAVKNGYWLAFAPSFRPTAVIRDFPLGIEPTHHRMFPALSFLDLIGSDMGLLVLHPGSQYFRLEDDGTISNLLMREWESYFTGEYGWPSYSEFRHALLPYTGDLSNSRRLRAAEEFSQSLFSVVSQPHEGDLPTRQGFLSFTPENAHLLAFRRKDSAHFEMRLTEVEGREANASVHLGFPVSRAAETDLLGRRIADVVHDPRHAEVKVRPWRAHTVELS